MLLEKHEYVIETNQSADNVFMASVSRSPELGILSFSVNKLYI